jgi:hypothetical protein
MPYPTLGLQPAWQMFVATAHPRIKIGQYLWPGVPAARIHKVDLQRMNHVDISFEY